MSEQAASQENPQNRAKVLRNEVKKKAKKGQEQQVRQNAEGTNGLVPILLLGLVLTAPIVSFLLWNWMVASLALFLVFIVFWWLNKKMKKRRLPKALDFLLGSLLFACAFSIPVFLVAKVVLGFVGGVQETMREQQEAITTSGDSMDMYGACIAAKDAIKGQLKAPSTASFPWGCKEYVTELSTGHYTVRMYVDAENSFGAKLRANYICDVYAESDSWRVSCIEQ